MFKFFQNRRKKKFLNRLKYGQDKAPVYTSEAMAEAILAGDEEKAQKIFDELLKHKLEEHENA